MHPWRSYAGVAARPRGRRHGSEVSPSEIAFLALGLVLGAAVGAAIVEAISRRPAPRREVRLTIVPNSIRQRPSATLADPDGRNAGGRIPGSPDDGAWPDRASPATGSTRSTAPQPTSHTMGGGQGRTPVPSAPLGVSDRAIAIPVERSAEPAGTGFDVQSQHRSTTSALAVLAALDQPAEPVSVRPASERPPVHVSPAAVAVLDTAEDARAGDAPEPIRDADREALADDVPEIPEQTSRPAAGRELEPPAPPAAPPASVRATAPDADPCAGARTLVEERCQVAASARDKAKAALDALREAQREYDVLREQVDTAQAEVDPRTIAAAKEALHREFRSATATAGDAEATERAAREWLDQVNELNGRTRAATREVERGNAALREAAPRLDRMAVDADVARIAAESAEIACREAREALAACEEPVAAAELPVAGGEEPAAPSWPASAGPAIAEPPVGVGAVTGGGSDLRDLPIILRVLRGDRPARDRLVATVASDNPAAAGEWQIRIAQLVDAIVARAIEDGYLDLPDDAPFWSLFSAHERRDIVGALSALGYRFDGLGGFADARVPVPRDLSLAVGYAGLDRMRIRAWPQEDELAQLYARATVAADEWLAAEAGDLSLGLMVDALGARATDLADVWNAWGRLRPAMLATA
jgi:hypothetical protein